MALVEGSTAPPLRLVPLCTQKVTAHTVMHPYSVLSQGLRRIIKYSITKFAFFLNRVRDELKLVDRSKTVVVC